MEETSSPPSEKQIAPSVKEEEKPKLKDYKSEDKEELARTKIVEYTEVSPKNNEENEQKT